MSTDTKVIIGVVAASVVLLIGAVGFFSYQAKSTPANNQEVQAVDLSEARDDGYNAQGNPTALVKIVEFSDFQCPACKSVAPALKQLASEYQDRVRFVYNHYPLPQHQNARMAAEAAEAAGAQGKFWEMGELLFANQDNLSEQKIKELAASIEGLKKDQFNQELDAHKYNDQVVRDMELGKKIGVNSTPSIYINGVKYEETFAMDSLRAAVDKALLQVPQVNIEASGSAEASGSGKEKVEDNGEVEVKK